MTGAARQTPPGARANREATGPVTASGYGPLEARGNARPRGMFATAGKLAGQNSAYRAAPAFIVFDNDCATLASAPARLLMHAWHADSCCPEKFSDLPAPGSEVHLDEAEVTACTGRLDHAFRRVPIARSA